MSTHSTTTGPVRLTSMDAYRGFVMFLMMAEVLHVGRVAAAFPDSGFWRFLDFHTSLSSAVRKTVVRICRGLRISSPRFLHYIFTCVLNGATLLGQVQVQSLQEFSQHPLRSRHCAQTQFTDVLADLDRQDYVQ